MLPSALQRLVNRLSRPARRRLRGRPPYRPTFDRLEDRLAPAVINWDGGGDGTTWTQAANWAGDVLPGASDDAVIGSAFAGVTVSVPSNTTVRSVTSAAPLRITGGTFTIGPGSSEIGRALTVENGATLTLGTSMQLLIKQGVTLTVNGNLTINDADTVRVEELGSGVTAGIVVNGTMTVTATDFLRAPSGFPSDISRLQVNPGGRLIASNSLFAWEQLNWADGSVLNPGDLSANAFDTAISAPALHIPLLASNRRFQDVGLLPGSLSSGQNLVLNLLGTDTTVNMRYVFQGAFTVQSGATLTLGTNVRALLRQGVTLTANGTLNINDADTIAAEELGSSVTVGIVVNGTMTVSATDFLRAPSGFPSDVSRLQVNPGGRLIASNSVFAWEQLNWADGSILNPTDLSGNGFDTAISLPALHVPKLANNRRFQDVGLLAGSLSSGQALNLDLLGTDTTVNMRYAFQGAFTVQSGAALTVGPNVRVLIRQGVLLTINGRLTVNDADTVAAEELGSSVTAGIVVNGTMTVSATDFLRAPGGFPSDISRLQVNSGGLLTVTGSRLEWESMVLNGGSSATLRFNAFATQLAIHSAASVTISQNDFSNASATVVSSGDPNASIDLRDNYWGTTDAAQIEAKITHRPDNPVNTRPLVLFSPPLSAPPPAPAAIQGIQFDDLNGNGVRDAGEPGLGGVILFLDANNNGTFDTGERSTTTQVDDPLTPGFDETGFYRFDALLFGTYVLRQFTPGASAQTFPPPTAITTTPLFDGTGDEAGITVPGASTFTFKGATFSGGSVFSPSQAALRASGLFAYNVSSGSAAIDFNRPIDLVRFFFVHGFGFGAGTATAFAWDGSVLGSVNSNAATTNGDPANFVTLNPVLPIARIQFSGGVIDNFTFTTQANDQAYYLRLLPGQTVGSVNFGNVSVPPTFVVSRLIPTSAGFSVQFNRTIDTSVLNLYNLETGGPGPADLTVVGAVSGAVRGSLVLESGNRFTFIRTGGPLPPDTYTVTLRSAANAFRDMGGNLLDGNSDGTGGDNFVTTFTIAPSPAVVVSVPDFMRGPGQPVNVPANAALPGIPLRLSNGDGIDSIDLTLRYDPALLTVTGAAVGPAVPAGATVIINTTTPGVVVLSFLSPRSLPAGPIDFVRLIATVPTNAPYRDKHVLDLTGIQINEGAIPAVDDDGLHVAAFFGDVAPSGMSNVFYSSLDAVRTSRVVVGLDSGFEVFPLADPTVLADITSNGSLSSTDAVRLLQEAIGQDRPEIPPVPAGITVTPIVGPDPLLNIPSPLPLSPSDGERFRARPGDIFTVPVNLDLSDGLESADLAISYDSRRLEVLDVQRGSLTEDFNFFAVRLDATAGTIRVGLGRTAGPVSGRGGGSVLTITVRVRSDAPAGPAIVNLRRSLGLLTTGLNEGWLDLNPDPSDEAGDVLDGVIMVRREDRPLRRAARAGALSALPALPADQADRIADFRWQSAECRFGIADLNLQSEISTLKSQAAERLDAFFCTYGAERPRVGRVVTALDLADLEFRTRRRRAVPS
ncbi:MAG TPA: cohesin domain-containing protein [Gemmataceae bacterium]|nr:cohesin domain-containing protein [Gemmataceae bacterium]